jgi:hypothetical protein
MWQITRRAPIHYVVDGVRSTASVHCVVNDEASTGIHIMSTVVHQLPLPSVERRQL